MSVETRPVLELDDIQSGSLRERPSPYVGRYLLLQLHDPGEGRELVRRLHILLAAQNDAPEAETAAWVTVAFTSAGLAALGVPQSMLDTFPDEFREGMARRAQDLGDVGTSGPEHWEWPLGTDAVHVAVAVLARDERDLELVAERARQRYVDLPSIEVVWRQDCYQLPSGRTSFGFKDGIGNPDVEGSGLPLRNDQGRPIKAGEFILG